MNSRVYDCVCTVAGVDLSIFVQPIINKSSCCRFITQEGQKLEVAPRPPMAVTNAVSWRSEGIKHRKNEVFLDVIESVNLLVSSIIRVSYLAAMCGKIQYAIYLQVSSNGNVLRSEIVGAIKMRVFLSGMPELRLGLNDKVLFEHTGRESEYCTISLPSFYLPYCGDVMHRWVSAGGKSKSVELEDTKFHQCVRLSRFENDRTISFIPPDGEFELMSYRLNTHVRCYT